MASVHQVSHSRYWYCAYRDADGQRVFRTTKQTKISEAWRIAHALEDAARDAVNGKITEAHLNKTIALTVEKVHPGSSVMTTIRKWVMSWVDNKSASRADKTGIRYRGIAKAFLQSLGKKADQSLSSLNQFDVQKFRDARVKDGLSNSSADLILKTIRSCLGLAVRQQLLSTNPAEGIDLLGRNKTSKRAFTNDEVRNIYDTAPTDEWKELTLFGYYVGGRLQNCVLARWEQIDFISALFKYDPVKQRRGEPPKSITIPIHKELLSCLERRRQTTGYVFPTLACMSVEGESGLSRTFRGIIDDAGVKYSAKQPRGRAGRQSFDVGFHALRRSFNTRLANSNVSQELRQRLLGQVSEEVNDGYTEIEMGTFRAAISKLPSLLNQDSSSSDQGER
jgi:integrase